MLAGKALPGVRAKLPKFRGPPAAGFLCFFRRNSLTGNGLRYARSGRPLTPYVATTYDYFDKVSEWVAIGVYKRRYYYV